MRPLLIDICCGAGGASMGYFRAGFDVIGVDIKPQPYYPFRFVQMDFTQLPVKSLVSEKFWGRNRKPAALHLSPPCQAHCSLRHLHNGKAYPDLIPSARDIAIRSGLPYVIENVIGAPLINPVMLCGTMFGLGVDNAELQRHRLFESNWLLMSGLSCQHFKPQRIITVTGDSAAQDNRRSIVISVVGKMAGQQARRRVISVTGSTPQQNTERNVSRETFTVDQAREAMGIDWMPMCDLSQSIPPAYTEFIGQQLIEVCRGGHIHVK